jgi:hypothetical protein
LYQMKRVIWNTDIIRLLMFMVKVRASRT